MAADQSRFEGHWFADGAAVLSDTKVTCCAERPDKQINWLACTSYAFNTWHHERSHRLLQLQGAGKSAGQDGSTVRGK